MDRNSDSTRPRSAAEAGESADIVADRLDRHAAERVIRRAIELHGEHLDETYDARMIHRVAGELGISSQHVARALAEELTTPETSPRSLLDRLFIERSVAVARFAHGPVGEVTDRTREWMSRHEGLRVVATGRHETVWKKNPSPMVSVRSGLKLQQGTGSLRTVRAVTTSTRSVGDDTAVSLVADTSTGRTVAWTSALVGAIALIFANGGIIAGAMDGSLLSVSFLLAAIGSLIVAITTAAAISKAWASQVRAGLERAATGIAEPDALERTESLAEMLGRLGREWRSGRSGHHR